MLEFLNEVIFGNEESLYAIAWWIPLAISALRAKGQQHQAGEARKQESITAALSPWTGMQAQRVQDPDSMGTILQGAMAGAQIQQGQEAATQAAGLQEQQLNRLKAQTKYIGAQADYLKSAMPGKSTVANTLTQTPVQQIQQQYDGVSRADMNPYMELYRQSQGGQMPSYTQPNQMAQTPMYNYNPSGIGRSGY